MQIDLNEKEIELNLLRCQGDEDRKLIWNEQKKVSNLETIISKLRAEKKALVSNIEHLKEQRDRN